MMIDAGFHMTMKIQNQLKLIIPHIIPIFCNDIVTQDKKRTKTETENFIKIVKI